MIPEKDQQVEQGRLNFIPPCNVENSFACDEQDSPELVALPMDVKISNENLEKLPIEKLNFALEMSKICLERVKEENRHRERMFELRSELLKTQLQ